MNDITDELLKGVCDIHLHASPNSSARSVSEWSFSVDAQRAGYRAVMPHPIEGMRQCIKGLLETGLAKVEIDRLVHTNPAYLIRINNNI